MAVPSLADLRAFVTVGELQSFAAAAKALHLSQPALSRRISHLEDLLGVRLFDRTTRSVALTLLGQRFLDQVRGTVDDLDRSVANLRDAAQMEAGDVTIGCVFSAVHHFLPPVIRSFREQHPRVLVRIIEEGADEVLAAVQQGEADFAINYIGMQEPELEFTPLLREPYVLACPAGHPLARRKSVRWEELADYPHARVSHASRNRLLIDQALAELPPLPRPVCEVRHVSTLIGMVENGMGVAVVPQLTLPRSPASVVGVKLEKPEVARTVGMTWRRGRSLSPAAAAFVDLLTRASRARVKGRP
ncbi:LysR family transcriptional regulator [Ramlibacter albus]|uniref:LysR family transcriptional regulator n=1 Tax=Ramlibacter albus TaxID=2079448 RepID=A0A923S3D5_9BURK|nr:LysR family transcriptional regulator [Ramlibacter albus]MBC5765728.1 LysR family transcriptional regulator [Ramlibacter albus]